MIPNLPKFISKPLSGLYGAVIDFRNFLYSSGSIPTYKSALPVISIGNVTVGGAGKSPFAAYIARTLHQMGFAPAILSRGYGGSISAPHLVTTKDTVVEVGDEAMMQLGALEDEVKIVIARRRAAGAKFIEKKALANVIVLDDGFQHRRLERDVNILLVDAAAVSAKGFYADNAVLPQGYLRESVAKALPRASCIVIVEKGLVLPHVNEHYAAAQKLCPDIPVFVAKIEPEYFVDAFNGELLTLGEVRGMLANAITAIAQPDRFFDMLSVVGVEVLKKQAFPDHYIFTGEEWREISDHGRMTVSCTSKDAVKLSPFVTGPRQLLAMAIDVRFPLKEHQVNFWNFLQRHLNSPSTSSRS